MQSVLLLLLFQAVRRCSECRAVFFVGMKLQYLTRDCAHQKHQTIE